MKRLVLLGILLVALTALSFMLTDATAMPAAAPSTTPTPQVFLPHVQNGACTTHTASLTLSAPTAVRVGDVVTITARLSNDGCANIGLPLYRLSVQPDGAKSLFDPASPSPVEHYVGIAPGGSDSAVFVLRAIRAGQATVSATASYEVHLGYPGPAYWGISSAVPIIIPVGAAPSATRSAP
jgi:hypothetical protein